MITRILRSGQAVASTVAPNVRPASRRSAPTARNVAIARLFMDSSSIIPDRSPCFRGRSPAPGAGPQEVLVCLDDAGKQIDQDVLLGCGQASEHPRL